MFRFHFSFVFKVDQNQFEVLREENERLQINLRITVEEKDVKKTRFFFLLVVVKEEKFVFFFSKGTNSIDRKRFGNVESKKRENEIPTFLVFSGPTERSEHVD